MRSRRARLAAASALVAWLPASFAGAEDGGVSPGPLHPERQSVQSDAVVAFVGGEALLPGVDVILDSDVRFRMSLYLARAGSAPRETSALFLSVVDELIAEILLAREAVRVDVRTPTPADERTVLRKLKEQAGGAEAFEALCLATGVDDDEVMAIVRRRALADAFLRSNLEGASTVSAAEVASVMASGEHPFGDVPEDQRRPAVRAWLAERHVERAVARWVTVLRARNAVRLVRVPESR